MKFNEKIKALRNKAKLSQQELANQLNIHVTRVSKIENGHLLPSIDIVRRLTKIFNISADQLINEDKEDLKVSVQDKEFNEQVALINQLDEDEKNALLKIIDSMLTKKRMKDLIDEKLKFGIAS
jgi:transcriptional regulator with XRE-family HTH domain